MLHGPPLRANLRFHVTFPYPSREFPLSSDRRPPNPFLREGALLRLVASGVSLSAICCARLNPLTATMASEVNCSVVVYATFPSSVHCLLSYCSARFRRTGAHARALPQTVSADVCMS